MLIYSGAYGGPGLGDDNNPYSTHFGPISPSPYAIRLAWSGTILSLTLYGVARFDMFGKELSPDIASRRLGDRAFKFEVGASGIKPFNVDLYPNDGGPPVRIDASCARYEVGRGRPPFGLHVQRSATAFEVFDVRAFTRIEFISDDAPIAADLESAHPAHAAPAGAREALRQSRIDAGLWTTQAAPIATYCPTPGGEPVAPSNEGIRRRQNEVKPNQVTPIPGRKGWQFWRKS